MNLKPIIQSEISQKETNKYHILTPIYRLQKDGTNEPICRAAMEMKTQRTDLRTWGRRGGEKRGWDEWREQYGNTNVCKIDSQWGFAV